MAEGSYICLKCKKIYTQKEFNKLQSVPMKDEKNTVLVKKARKCNCGYIFEYWEAR